MKQQSVLKHEATICLEAWNNYLCWSKKQPSVQKHEATICPEAWSKYLSWSM